MRARESDPPGELDRVDRHKTECHSRGRGDIDGRSHGRHRWWRWSISGSQYWPSAVGIALVLAASVGAASAAPQTPGPEPASATDGDAALAADPSTSSRARALSRDADRRRLGEGHQASLQATASRLASRRTDELTLLRERAAARSAELRRQNTWVLPVESYRLTGRFGESSSLWSSTHTGLDFAAPDGTEIRSVAAGVVSEAGWAGSYGYRSVVRLSDGTVIWYCHQSQLNVATGERVAPGQAIGRVGSTGNVTGPHLHLEIRPGGGAPVDPYAALSSRGLNP